MNNYIAEGKVLDITTPIGGVVSSQGLLLGSIFGVVGLTAAAGEPNTLAISGVFELAKAAVGWSAGDKLYWDDTAKKVTNVASTNRFVGIALQTRIAGDTLCRVVLLPGGSADLDTIAEIVTALEALTGADKLSADALKDGTTNKAYTASEKTKLAGIETGADVTDAVNVTAAGAFMKAVDDLDDITEGATNKAYTAYEKAKLGGIGMIAFFSDAHVVTAGEAAAGQVDINTGFGVAPDVFGLKILRGGNEVYLDSAISFLGGGDVGKIRIASGVAFPLLQNDVLYLIAIKKP